MLKMTIDDENVVSNKDITIKEEMLGTSSTILNNVYPEEWEEDKDYVSRFYYPEDYSKLRIQNEVQTQEYEAGTTIQVNGSTTLTDVDTTKNSKVLRLLGQTSQTGTPTPSSPVPVNVVSGDNEINVCGKNLFNKDGTSQVNRAYDGSGNIIIDNGSRAFTDYIPVRSNANIYVSGTDYIRLCEYDMNKTFIQRTGSGSLNYLALTTTNNTKYIRLSIVDGKETTTQIEYRTSASTYEPYVGNIYPINLPVENLFNKNGSVVLNKRLAATGTEYSENGYYSSPFIKVNSSTKYSKNSPLIDAYHRVCFYSTNADSGFISKIDNSNTFTTPSNCTYLRFCGLQTELDTAQLEEGNVNTYTPYGITPIELCKIGTYQDYIYKDNGYWYKYGVIAKKVLNGSESYNFLERTGVNVFANNGTYASTIYKSASNKNIISDCFKSVKDADGNVANSIRSNNSGQVFIAIPNTESIAQSVSAFTNWLASNNVTTYYILATPVITQITDTTLIEQLEALTSQ